MAVVMLDTALFREMYPTYAKATDEVIKAWWSMVCQMIDNTEASPIPYNPPGITTRLPILYAALCHVAFLMTRDAGAVGRIASAAEGSVNTSFDLPTQSKSASWWVQSQCGAIVWQLLRPFRTGGLYFAGGPKY